MPMLDCPFRHVSEHVCELVPRRLSEYVASGELIIIMYMAVREHKAYYDAGFMHGNVSEANIMIFDGETDEGKQTYRGVMLDLDDPYLSKPLVKEHIAEEQDRMVGDAEDAQVSDAKVARELGGSRDSS
ncbi:uncharacterized protein LAESUDRAFT_749087 [Laetiporus sulphureus 93-53]|uniref:Fungal-type protein kinase domain-containing protein n=1 Tax=Laetiporus sulphureus 93-53 TaxID=1314785 RepID=A0A165F2N3_9APHY|nr:uncharacterized protein LAESUDRAFT_749087 [Laetiporus sulphureus 93-53]KZT08245.1 hypothetical protein LAESUDRAFT_749087 [Laetiporus sulphureus 93-53]